VNTDQKLGERISELYGQVVSYPGRPSNSQINRTNVLDDELKVLAASYKKLIGEKLAALNKELTKKNIGEIKPMTEEEFRTKDNLSSAASNYFGQACSNWQYLPLSF
jgi:hypothetical protein